MIKPGKYTDLNCTTIEVISIVLQAVKANGAMKFDELYDLIILKKGNRSKDIFISSLNILFLLGKLNYIEKLDSIGYIE